MKKAIFLDRDGVINKLVLNTKTKDYGAPLSVQDLKFYSWAAAALKKIQDAGFLLFIVSNQPDYAKGYTSLKNVLAVQKKVRAYFKSQGIRFKKYYYCFHHPVAKVKRYRLRCRCRKPGSLFLSQAKKNYRLNMRDSWMIGDSDSDIYCGQAMKTKTVLIQEKYSKQKRGASHPLFLASNLEAAIRLILRDKGRVK